MNSLENVQAEKNQYIRVNLENIIQSWSSLSALFGAFIFLSLGIMDYLVTPENFKLFMLYRVAASCLLMLIFALSRLKKNIVYHYALLILGIIISAVTIELMILSFGGHKSPYYAGMNLLIICVLGIIPLDITISFFAAIIVYSIYLFPIIMFDQITHSSVFITNNIFIIFTFLITLAWRIVSKKSLLHELGLQYELQKEKKKLEEYSNRLEQLVQERTKSLANSEKWYRALFDNATDGIVILNTNGIIININQRACDLTGCDGKAVIGSHISILEGKGDKERHQEFITRALNSESLIYEIARRKNDGSRVFIEVSSKAIVIGDETYIQSFYRDVTEKKSVQEQFLHSQKMESIGILAGGIAHNFNNILTAISGYAEILLEFGNLDEKSREKVHGIERSARKAGVMIGQMLRFARREAHEVVPMNLNDIISETLKLFESASNKNIQSRVDLDTNTPISYGDPNQIEQIIMNLLVNAKDAMPNGGIITISTRLVNVESESPNVPKYIVPGRYIKLSVSDTGAGIPDEIRNNIFDPFFTTKERGKGTGLGLATVYGIVKDHKGYVSVQSAVGKGTTFDIYLPVGEVTSGHEMKKDE